MFRRTHESMEIQFSIDGIHKKWLFCLPTWDQKVISVLFSLGLGLSLKTETYKIPVSDSVSILRLSKCRSRTLFQNWDLKKFSLRLGLEIETKKIWVLDPVSKLRRWKFQSRTWSRNAKVSLADPLWGCPPSDRKSSLGCVILNKSQILNLAFKSSCIKREDN